MKGGQLTRLEMGLARLGLSPSDAPRVQAQRAPEPNEFDDFA